MDHMNIKLNKTVGITCLSMLLHLGANAQNQQSPVPQQDPAAKSVNSSDTSSSNTEANKTALASDSASKAKSDLKVTASVEPSISAPTIGIKNPSVNIRVAARESKTDVRNFSMPDVDSLGEPQSFQATAYALRGRTRSGVYVRRGVIAADPRVLPLGSVVQIKAGKYTGVYTVYDTGGKIKGNIIDLWVPDNREARQFGRRKIKLQVLKLGPGKARKR